MPMQMSVRVTDHGVYQGLRKVGDGLPQATDEELWAFMQAVQLKASGGYQGGNTYSDVPERGYVRTGNYGRSFNLERTGLTYTLRNATYTPKGSEYGKYVGGGGSGEGQRWTWWPVIRYVLDQMVFSELVSRVDNALRDFIRSCGIGL